MPELPDLEVFAENLEKRFKNKTLEKVTVTVTRKLNVPEKEVITALEGHKLLSVNREGKTVQLHFGGGAVLGLHLMLHGELVLLDWEATAKHQVIAFYFRGNEGFALTDFQKASQSAYSIPFLKYSEGYKYHEIADGLQIPIGTVKTHLYKNADSERKRVIIGSIFPEKWSFDGQIHRTTRVNEAASLIYFINTIYVKKNRNQVEKTN